MKIFILPINKKFQPQSQTHNFPEHNEDFGIEQDFLKYLLNNKDLVTQNYKKADWHFLPAYWTRWHINHNYAQSGLDELQKEVNRIILDDKKTFTICQFDKPPYDSGPLVNTGKAVLFLAPKNNDLAIGIPLLSSSHKKPFFTPKKKYLASFVGNLETHSMRKEMADLLQNRQDIYIFDTHKNSRLFIIKILRAYLSSRFRGYSRFFVKRILQSYISLAPRGSSTTSFRFYESMQLGVVPFLIGNIDTRPFKKFINWDEISFYTDDVGKVADILDSVNKKDLILMGKKCQKIYQEKLAYQKWCPFVIKELSSLR